MLDPALLKLMRLQGRGLLRRMRRGFATPRGALFFLVGVLIFVMWVVSVGLAGNRPRPAPRSIRAVAPLMLLGVCVISAMTAVGEKAIAFTPGEVDFLFPGPFRRRQLLFYKLTKSSIAALLTALVMSVAMRRYASFWPACYVGIFLSLLFVQFFSTALLLVGQTVTETAFSRGRKLALAGVAVLVVLGLRGAVGFGAGSLAFPALAEQLAGSETGKVLLAPFNVFGQTITAERIFPDLLEWSAGAVLINAGLLAVVVRLDANYLEAAAGATQRRYERLRRVRGGSGMALGTRSVTRRGLPQPPFLFGIGPIAWRQLTNAYRSARGLLVVLIMLVAICGPLMLGSLPVLADMRQQALAFLVKLAGAVLLLSFMAASMMKFDFRADLDAMESVKTLPLRPWAVGVGQLVAPVAVLTLVDWVLLVAIGCTIGHSSAYRQALACTAVLVLPFNCLLFAAENLIFLVFPTRPAAVGPGDFQVLGRQILTLGLRTLIVMVAAGIAVGFGVVAYRQTDRSLSALTMVTAAFLLLEAAALLPLIATAFGHFDPSRHTPAA